MIQAKTDLPSLELLVPAGDKNAFGEAVLAEANAIFFGVENFNARNLSIELIGEKADIITVDVSFISQTYIIPGALSVLKSDGLYICLIKPQFEVGKENIGKGGIVKNKQHHLFAVNKIIDCLNNYGLICIGLTQSPILGGDGNTEFMAMFSTNGKEISKEYIRKTVLN